MSYRSTLRHARISSRKVRLIADLIRGKYANDAINILKYQPHRGARMLEKVLKSAIANAEDRGERSLNDLVVVECRVDGGPMFKRIRPVSRGMAYGIKRRMSHIHVAVDKLD